MPTTREATRTRMIPNIYHGLLVNGRISSLVHQTIAVPLPPPTQPPKFIPIIRYGMKTYKRTRL